MSLAAIWPLFSRTVPLMTKRPTSFDDLPLTLRVEELMPVLNVGRNTAYELIRCGKIRSIRIGKQLRIPKQALIDYLSSNYQ